jgi:benzoyl-CoA reductase/2-hydroxyglutaryl-CoA dehydratase subunit BcrC/BadD/HgdB
MSGCGHNPEATPASGRGGCACAPPAPGLAWFAEMVPHCYEHATSAKAAGRPVVGMMCEYTPRELVFAAGGFPVCLCGGDAAKIPPAEEVLPSNLCPLIKSTFGYHRTGTNPFLEMADLLVAETTCDGKKKMYELMGETRPMHVLELPQKPGDPAAFAHWLSELEKLRDGLERRFGVEITDERLREGIRAMNRERALRRALAEQMRRDPPPFTGRELLDFKSLISCLPADLEQYERIRDTAEAAPGREDLAGRVRVLLTGVPTAHGAERIVDLIEAHGGVIVCQENCTGLKPILEDVDESVPDPLRAIAETYFHLPCSVMTPNDGRLEMLRRLAGDYRPGAVIDLVWQACLTYDVETHRIRRWAETEADLPYLRIETDYSPSDSARIALRIEALFETVRARRKDGA